MSENVKADVPGYVPETLESRLLILRGRNPQTIDPFVIDYILDPEEKILKAVGKTDVNDKIQSCADCALSRILDQYLDDVSSGDLANVVIDEDSEPVSGSGFVDKLEDNLQAVEYLDQLKERYNLDPSLSLKEAIDFLNKNKTDYENILKSAIDSNKEVKKDEEKEIVKENEQEKL